MKFLKIILVATLSISLAGCVLSGKPKAPAAPATTPLPTPTPKPVEPLSMRQTNPEDVPPAETVNFTALKMPTQPVETVPPPTVSKPATPNRTIPPRPQPQPPPSKPPDNPTPPVEVTRPPIQEILPAEEKNRLRVKAQEFRSDTRTREAAVRRARVSQAEKSALLSIDQFLKQSEQAEKSGDMRAAYNFAEKALLLVKELQVGK